MSTEPPPLPLGGDEDEDDLFGGGGTGAAPARSESGYTSASAATSSSDHTPAKKAPAGGGGGLLDDDEDDDDLFGSSKGLEPTPRGAPPAVVAAAAAPAAQEIPLDDDEEEEEEENPFQNAHLNPTLQLSSGQHSTAATAPTPTPSAGAANGANGQSAARADGAVGGQSLDAAEQMELEGNDEFIDIKVIQPHKVGDGMSSYMVYKVQTRTNVNYFRRKEMSVERRFSDFLGLHDKLSEKYLQNGRVIPPAPDKSIVGTTKVKMAKEAPDEGSANPVEFVEVRRAALERFLNRITSHPSLRTDPDFREFLELEAELPKSNQTAALSGKSMMRLISKVGDKVSSMTLKMDETDEWFAEKSRTIEELDAQLRKLHASTESLYEYRRNLAFSTGQLAKSLAVLAAGEENSELSRALAQLSAVEEKLEHVHADQATADFYQLAEMVKDYIGLVAAVRDVFHEREKAWQQWQNLTTSLTRKRESKVKAELQQKPEKVSLLRQEIADLERQQEMAQENFDKISRLIKKEVQLFDATKGREFKRNLVLYLEVMLRAQEDVAGHWERYLPEIRKQSSGGGN